jgi:hypothetical protein
MSQYKIIVMTTDYLKTREPTSKMSFRYSDIAISRLLGIEL